MFKIEYVFAVLFIKIYYLAWLLGDIKFIDFMLLNSVY
jgi:hypothetical protein